MKLHRLTLAAFGPFAGEEQIDFDALGENPLFLIDGPTGAGKSSILHAVCYALYGETTDAERKELGIRCDYAPPERLTEIALEFSIRRQRYRIQRVPTQLRPAKRGGGETEQKASAHLVRIDAGGVEETLVARKKSEADAQIKEILGLSADQFRQVMVLPQGKFRELLLAKSDERQAILSTLFQTEIYRQIEQQLKDRAGDIERQHKKFEDSKVEALLEIQLADTEALGQALVEGAQTLTLKAQQKEDAEQQAQTQRLALQAAETLQQRFAQQAVKQQALLNHRQHQPQIDSRRVQLQRADKAAAISAEWKALQSLGLQLGQKSTDLQAADQTVVQAQQAVSVAESGLQATLQRYAERDELKAQETRLIGYRKVLAGYEALSGDLQKANAVLTARQAELAQLEQSLVSSQQGLQNLGAEIEGLNRAVEPRASCTEQLLRVEHALQTATRCEAVRRELEQQQRASRLADTAWEQADLSYRNASREADRLELFWYTNQAALLAQKLQEDLPCPVCGSAEHPQPARLAPSTEAVDQQRLEQAREQASTLLQRRSDAEKERTTCQQAVQHLRRQLEEISAELGAEAQRPLADWRREQQQLAGQLRQIEHNAQCLQSARQRYQGAEAQQHALEAQRSRLQQALPELSANHASAASRLTAAQQELPPAYRSLDALEDALQRQQRQIGQLEAAYQQAQQTRTGAGNRLIAAQSTRQALAAQLHELSEQETAQRRLWQDALAASEFVDQADFERQLLTPTVLAELRAGLNQYDEQLKALNSQLELIAQQLEGVQVPDLAALQAQLQQAQAVYQEAQQGWLAARQQQDLLQRTATKIEALQAAQQAVQQQYDVVGRLAKAAAGRGQVRVSLERFVLGNLLDSVLGVASQRLYAMSKGQYKLVRQNEADQKRTLSAGLDLAIDDAYSGKTRPVATLSGGESFMASLALALALSDVVQQRSGGIQLDTLFIDEGFGSLDQESLQLAIDMLVELQASGRTIGVISHVSELKEQMALRIDVRSTRAGSSVAMSAG